jgi:hypothetical protein
VTFSRTDTGEAGVIPIERVTPVPAACSDASATWVPPDSAALIAYDPAPPWDGGVHCAGGLLPGAQALGELLLTRFPQIFAVYGYECRPNSAFPNEQSVHGTGRAVDLAIPPVLGRADRGAGDAVANWLVQHSVELGVQLIIWNGTLWLGDQPPPKYLPYPGPNPHIDHIHVELTQAASTRTTLPTN